MTRPRPAGAAGQPLVSIIMNCYNGEKYLREAIESVLAQTYGNWEIIFWDNASTDGSAAIAASYGDPRLRYFRGDVNIPLGAARNEAVARARGEFLTFLDTDDLWFPDKLAAQVEYFAAHPDADFVYTNLVSFDDGSGPVGPGRKPAFLLPQPDGQVFGRFLRRYPVTLVTVMVRLSALRELGEIFDPTLQIAEEFDLFMRLLYRRQAGYLPKALAAYRLHPGQDSRKKIALYAVEAEHILRKLQRCFPESKPAYGSDYAYHEAKIAYYHARAALRQGDKAKARELIAPHRWRGWRFLVVSIALSLPGDAMTWLHKLTGRYH